MGKGVCVRVRACVCARARVCVCVLLEEASNSGLHAQVVGFLSVNRIVCVHITCYASIAVPIGGMHSSVGPLKPCGPCNVTCHTARTSLLPPLWAPFRVGSETDDQRLV